MSLNHNALLAGLLAAASIVVLLLAIIGAGSVTRTVFDFADDLRAERAWRRTTRTAATQPAEDEDGWTALADAVRTPPQAEPGTTDWLYDLHPNAPRWEDQ